MDKQWIKSSLMIMLLIYCMKAQLLDFDRFGGRHPDHIIDLDRPDRADLADQGCRCLVIENRGRRTILKNFGKIQTCGMGLCGCGQGRTGSCRQVCETLVKSWAANNCPAVLKGMEVKAFFRAEDCNEGIGDNTHDCHGRGTILGLDIGLRVSPGIGAGRFGGGLLGDLLDRRRLGLIKN